RLGFRYARELRPATTKRMFAAGLECLERLVGLFFSSSRRHTGSVSAFLLNRSSDLVNIFDSSEISESVNFCVMEAIKLCRLDTRSEERRVGKECRWRGSRYH